MPEGSGVGPAPPVCGWERPHFTCKSLACNTLDVRSPEEDPPLTCGSFDPTRSRSAPGPTGTAGGPGRALASVQ